MPLNKDLIAAARNLPHDDELDVQGFDLQLTAERPTPAQLFLDGDRDELARRCKAELGPDAYALAWAWANAVESETGDYYSDAEARRVATIARHFPGLETAIRAVHEHVDREGAEPWPARCTWVLDSAEDSDSAA